MELNANSVNAKYYDIVYSLIKGSDVVDEEVSLVLDCIHSLDFQASKKSTAKILDIGCGTGRHAIELAKLIPNSKITCLDITKELLDIAEAKAHNLNLANMNFVNENFFDFQTSEEFDLVIMFWNSLNEIALSINELENFLKKLNTILRKGGRLLINIDDVDNVVDIPNINHSMTLRHENKRYQLDWEVVAFDKEKNITISKESITVFDSLDQQIDCSSGEIIQKWWKKSEVVRLLKKYSLFLQNSAKLLSNEELYLEFVKNERVWR